MGFLDRMWDSLFGRGGRDTPSPHSRAARSSASGTAVLDAPPESQTQGALRSGSNNAVSTDTPDRWWAPEGITTTEPCWVEPVELIGEMRSLEARLISHFDGHDLSMPPMPHVAERVLKSLRDPKCSMTELAKVLSDDQVTAADVLRLVNSPLYRGAYKITTLQGAVTRLGTQVLRTLMLHQSLRSVAFPKKSEAHDLARTLWSRSLASGCIMRELAPLVRMDAEDAFTLGLLHDIGNVIVLRTVCEQKSTSQQWLDDATFEFLCYETHQEFGELIADEWQLPETIKSIVASHHAIPTADDPLSKERWLTLLSDMICQSIGYGPAREYDLLASEPARALGMAEHPDTERVLRELPERVSETIVHLQ